MKNLKDQLLPMAEFFLEAPVQSTISDCAMILFWTLPTLKFISKSCVLEALCPTLQAPSAQCYMCCTDGLNTQSQSRMSESHPICCACGNPQEGTRTGPPATSDALWVCTHVQGHSQGAAGLLCRHGRICSCAEKRLGLLDIWKSWQTHNPRT